jgi:hypothetical protein
MDAELARHHVEHKLIPFLAASIGSPAATHA